MGTRQMKLLFAVFACAGVITAQPPKASILMSRGLPELAGKETTMLTVELAPGGTGDVHRRNASNSKPAKFLVFMIKQKGAPIATPSK